MCWADSDCFECFNARGVSTIQGAHLRLAFNRWEPTNTAGEWHYIAEIATYAVPLDGTAALALDAFDNWLRVSGTCSKTAREWLIEKRKHLAPELTKSFELALHFDQLLASCK